MTPPADPYHTLGLARGASLAEVKRAYRALAKVNHPDAAGPGALPRFLAIQTAYEQVLHSAPASAGGAATRGATKPSTHPSAADPERADATHRAYGGRTRRSKTTGARPRPKPGPDPSAGRTATGDDRDGPNKATLGSTSYDGADAQPFEPDWGGASWYGTTSGTYWTINPKEYADPRKHGPEYQARARRAARARATAGTPASLGETPDPTTTTTGPDADAAPGDAPFDTTADADPSAGQDRAAHTTSSWWDSTSATADRTSDEAPEAAETRASATSARAASARSAAPPAGTASRADRPSPHDAAEPPPPDLAAAATDLGRALTDERTARGRWRLVQALVGWLPILFGLDWLLGEITGCGRYAASCGTAQAMLAPLAAAVALVVLLLVPMLASTAATGAVAVVVAAVPTVLVLSASGAAADQAPRAALLGVVLIVAWVVGVTVGVTRRLRRRRTGVSSG